MAPSAPETYFQGADKLLPPLPDPASLPAERRRIFSGNPQGIAAVVRKKPRLFREGSAGRSLQGSGEKAESRPARGERPDLRLTALRNFQTAECRSAPRIAMCRLATPRVRGICCTKGKPASRNSSRKASGEGKRAMVSAK